ncbi:ubiquitin-conjugating enzyme [Gregarina niphandrodes]|uniref:Ubiquitin-conjugating enzyme n=1 Tax=Gregarina niphandrodes TaxID=110365 RepID=A0A023B2E4_GRENI|nr:ubiquitin-conjugating enzyme [Gregarina niphandrodes]EZG51796.1 ubiquitin-conjugating enzyme [Gregarina niphandrodes]|eukprot:XP_011131907.1 ubiquitin-conjugating enzyme [Gregarina niphandrodes]
MEGLREVVALKVSNRERGYHKPEAWLLEALDQMGDCSDFVETTAKAEYLFNAQNPIEGVYIFFGDKAGYLHDLCVEFTISFPMNYPDQPVEVIFHHDIVHPHIAGKKLSRFGDCDHQSTDDSGHFYVRDLIDWNAVEHSTLHVLAAIKSMLFQPLEQPKILTEKSKGVRNRKALEELLKGQGCLQLWRERYIRSQINVSNKTRLSSRQDSARAPYDSPDADKGRNTLSNKFGSSSLEGGMYVNKRRSSIGTVEKPSVDLVVPASLKPYIADALNLEEISAQIDTHVNIMLKRLQADEKVGLFHIVNERVDVIHSDLQALLKW